MTQELVKLMESDGCLKSGRIKAAFLKIDRKDFVLDEDIGNAYINAPLSIGYGQTISQPITVAFMLELLEPKPRQKILDIGSGSGWQTALLSQIVSEDGKNHDGKVIAIERVRELKIFGEKNADKYGFVKSGVAKFVCGDGTRGLPAEAPFDGIIAAAAASEMPEYWFGQLKIGGRLVAPIKQSIWLFIKKSEKNFEKKEFPGFVFVPLMDD